MSRILQGPVRTAALVAALFVAISATSVARAGGPGGGYGGGGYGGAAYGGGGGYGGGIYGANGGYESYSPGSAGTPYWAVGPNYTPYASSGYGTGGFAPFGVNPAAQPNYPMGNSPAVAAPTSTRALLKVILPNPNATVTFNGFKTTSTGATREFRTGPLAEGLYKYDVQASWMQDGQMTTQTQKVYLAPGADLIVRFSPK